MPITIVKRPKAKSGHTKAKALIISQDQPGRLRIAHLLSLFSVSHSTLYQGMKFGRYPKPDGRDGNFPYWKTETIRQFLLG